MGEMSINRQTTILLYFQKSFFLFLIPNHPHMIIDSGKYFNLLTIVGISKGLTYVKI